MATINGGSGNDSLTGSAGQDTIDGNGGQDTIIAGSGHDTVDGGTGNDQIHGGDGDDVITGGAGDDTIEGGRGDDTLTAGNSSPTDTFVIRDGDGSDTITDFDPPEPDIIAFDMAEIQSFQDVLDRLTMSNGDTYITYDNGEQTRLIGVKMDQLTEDNFQYTAAPVCFGPEARVLTPQGERPILSLRVGDLVETLDQGALPILEILDERRHFRKGDPSGPILLRASCLRRGQPNRDLIVSPQHRFLRRNFDSGRDVLVPAVKLLGTSGIRRMRGRSSARYLNILLAKHALIQVSGCWVESVLDTPLTASRLGRSLLKMTPARPLSRSDPPSAISPRIDRTCAQIGAL